MFPLVMLYFSLFSRVEPAQIKIVCRVLGEVLGEKGAEINAKMGKPREHITLMLRFKQAVRHIFNAAETRCLEIEQTMERTFKKLLESLECTKNLAEYADFVLRECK